MNKQERKDKQSKESIQEVDIHQTDKQKFQKEKTQGKEIIRN